LTFDAAYPPRRHRMNAVAICFRSTSVDRRASLISSAPVVGNGGPAQYRRGRPSHQTLLPDSGQRDELFQDGPSGLGVEAVVDVGRASDSVTGNCEGGDDVSGTPEVRTP
jgi:hypothetical protein